jgi:mannose-1-phosphate guanylyltransferase
MPVGGRPLLEYWLQTLYFSGVRNVLVNKHFHSDKVDAFLAREQFVDWVSSVFEADLLGTAGTLRANSDFFRGHTTILIHADNWCQCDFGAFINHHLNLRPLDCPITMMTFDTHTPGSCGIVETDGRGVVTAFHEKVANPPGTRANAAVYMLEPEVAEWVDEHSEVTDFSTEVLPNYVGRISTWHNSGVHRDIGTLEALISAQYDPVPDNPWVHDDEWQRSFETLPIFRTLTSTATQIGLIHE